MRTRREKYEQSTGRIDYSQSLRIALYAVKQSLRLDAASAYDTPAQSPFVSLLTLKSHYPASRANFLGSAPQRAPASPDVVTAGAGCSQCRCGTRMRKLWRWPRRTRRRRGHDDLRRSSRLTRLGSARRKFWWGLFLCLGLQLYKSCSWPCTCCCCRKCIRTWASVQRSG